MDLRSGRLKGKWKRGCDSHLPRFDVRIFQADIRCNQAHTTMLMEQEIIPPEIGKILKALKELGKEGIEALKLDSAVEDIHMAVENYMTSKLVLMLVSCTLPSHNDQVATDLKIALKEEINSIKKDLLLFIQIIIQMAEKYVDTAMVGSPTFNMPSLPLCPSSALPCSSIEKRL